MWSRAQKSWVSQIYANGCKVIYTVICLYYPTIKKSWVSHGPFWVSVPIFEEGCSLHPVSCSESLCLSILWLPSPSSFFQHERETCHDSKILSLFGCMLLAYTNSDMATTDDMWVRFPLLPPPTGLPPPSEIHPTATLQKRVPPTLQTQWQENK